MEPHLLASAAENRLVVWDVSYARSDTASSWEYIAPSPSKITSISWCQSRGVFGCTSLGGGLTLFDIRTKLPSTRQITPSSLYSCIQFSPKNEHELVLSSSDLSDDHSVWSWDRRSMKNHLWKLCDHTGGTNSLSWSTLEDLILANTNNSKINILSTSEQKIISELPVAAPPVDLKWSNTVKGSFFASFDKELIAYKLDPCRTHSCTGSELPQ